MKRPRWLKELTNSPRHSHSLAGKAVAWDSSAMNAHLWSHLYIVKSVQGSKGVKNFKQVENYVQKLVQVQPLKKNVSSPSSQFTIDISQLSNCFVGFSGSIEKLDGKDGFQAIADSGWLNIKVPNDMFVKRVLEEIRAATSHYGSADSKCSRVENICVEYSSPNIAKPFHVGHLRSTIIGNVLSNLLEAVGHSVKRVNFLGDWGTQFGLLSLGLTRYADLEKLKSDHLLELYNLYVKINQDVKSECGEASEMTSETYQEGLGLFARLEKGDEGMKILWKMVNDLSLAELNKMYKRLGVHFTDVISESSYQQKTADVIYRLQNSGLMQYDDHGVGYVQMPEEKTIGRASIVKSDGSSLYLTRDIASVLDRQDIFNLDRMHYVVDQGQRGHFIKLLHILNKLSVPWAAQSINNVHIKFGRVKGMSTRQGKVVFLRDVLDEAKSRVIESMKAKSTTRVNENIEEIGDIIGVTCIVLQDLKSHRSSDYTFSWDRALNMKADSGIFVQYCHARLCSMLSGCGTSLTDDVDVNLIHNDKSLYNLVHHMARYPDVFSQALIKLEPHHIVQYLFKLCHLINVAYSTCPVKGQPVDIAQARLLVFDCSRQVVANCMKILGLQPLEKI
ncbi:arginine--tRNA ligase [Elysia marginata]|uniref:Probable arginine--tRNA ligase, mitochondrial n=1 Tax=Elysia marginata TaxID=1093978 RepID=A0AAV4FDB0_9GAST|nr:arginine--tRNA ligase [Elysia marginata]